MSRQKKDGLNYFSFDTDFFYADKRISKLHKRFGNDGIVFFIYLLTEIYRNGYYVRWDKDLIDDAIDLNLTEGLIEQMMTFFKGRRLLVEINISKGASNRTDTIITSPGIQKRYQEAAKGLRRDIFVDEEIWLLSKEETASCIKVTKNEDKSGKNEDKSGKNEDKSGKNHTKEMKRNEKKEKEIKGNKTTKAAPQQYYPDDLLNQAFLDFLDMREKIKKPMTERAIELAMKKLIELSTLPFSEKMDNDTAIKILEQSTMNCWQGLFPLKGDDQKANNSSDWEQRWRDA
ncbi:MAG: DUF4373 domain-containing protein [Roseburia sp.]|nr:DUF4373 domain-containing protein [Roseburia sp.]